VRSALAISSGQTVLLIVAGSVVLLAGLASVVLRGQRRESGADIPPVMKPGPSDADLETPVLQKLQGWGVVLVAFFVVWVPIVWLREPDNNLVQDRDLLTASVARGSREVQLFSEDNQLGVGCVRCHGPELRGGTVIPNGTNPDTGQPQYGYPANLTTVCSRLRVDEIRTTIEQGRIALGMPSWSIKYAGALDDQQITDLINYIVSINKKTVPFAQNKCINPELATTATPAAAPSATGGK
jgi:mono/diheme cytochrome c family protein